MRAEREGFKGQALFVKITIVMVFIMMIIFDSTPYVFFMNRDPESGAIDTEAMFETFGVMGQIFGIIALIWIALFSTIRLIMHDKNAGATVWEFNLDAGEGDTEECEFIVDHDFAYETFQPSIKKAVTKAENRINKLMDEYFKNVECPKCNNMNLDGGIYCSYCGGKLYGK